MIGELVKRFKQLEAECAEHEARASRLAAARKPDSGRVVQMTPEHAAAVTERLRISMALSRVIAGTYSMRPLSASPAASR